MRVAAGAIARKVVPGLTRARARWSRWARTRSTARAGTGTRSTTIRSSARTPGTAKFCDDYLDGVRKSGSSVGAVIEVVAEGVPPGLGAPVYGKLDADLAAALMSINAVKGVEIGDGFAAAALSGEDNADEMRMGNDGKPRVPVEPRRRHSRRHLDRAADRRALRGQADLVDPDAAQDRRSLRQRDRHHRPRAATIPASASARCRSARRWWRACSPIIICVIAARSARGRRWPFTNPPEPSHEAEFECSRPISASMQAIAAFARGEIVVVTDDDDRENEGDLFVAAVALHAGEDGVHHPPHLRHRLRAAVGRRRAAAASRSDGGARTTRRSAPPSPSRSTSSTA